jgi:hypothetical protein
LQRANSDADQFGDFLAAVAALDQISNLLDALGRELDLAATCAKLDDLKYVPSSCLAFSGSPPGTTGRAVSVAVVAGVAARWRASGAAQSR